MLVGSYSDFSTLAHLPKTSKKGQGVYCFSFSDGVITAKRVIPSENPAVLSRHPSKRNTVYVLSEGIDKKGVISKLDLSSLSLSPSSKWETGGRSLCYFSVDPVSLHYGIAINYWEGSLDLFAMNTADDAADISDIAADASQHTHIEHMAHSKRVETAAQRETNPRRLVADREDHWQHRQVGPHAHSVHYYGQWVFVPDLGENAIFQYAFDASADSPSKVLSLESVLSLPEGRGPRHMVLHKELGTAYVSNELSSTITVLAIDETEPDMVKSRMKIVQEVDTLSDAQRATSGDKDIWQKNYVAEIGMDHQGKFVYCSNRGYDTIAVFKVMPDDGGKLEQVSFARTYGQTPRHFAISPDNRFLVGANQDSNNLAVFRRDVEDGTLSLVKVYTSKDFEGVEGFEFAAPNFVLFTPDDEAEVTTSGKATRGSTGITMSWVVYSMMALFLAALVTVGASFEL